MFEFRVFLLLDKLNITKAEEPSLPYYLPITGERIIGFIPFPRVLVLCEMQSVSFRIWTRVAVSISYDDNHYTTGTVIQIRINLAANKIRSSSSCHTISTDLPDPISQPPPYRPLLLASLQVYIPYLHRAAVCRFELVVLSLFVNVKGSTGVHHLWVPPYFSSGVLHVWFI